MVAHRKTPSKRAYVLPGWFFVLTSVVVVAAAGWLVWLALDRPDDTRAAGPSATASASPSTSATPSEKKTTAPTPSPTATTPSPTPTQTTPSASRATVGVSVLNGSRTPGLARSGSVRVQQLGWTIGTVGNWRYGGVAQTSVYYPAGREAEARLLAKDLGIDAVAPALSGMSTERLTLVVLGAV